jgi:hypothetical protein
MREKNETTREERGGRSCEKEDGGGVVAARGPRSHESTIIPAAPEMCRGPDLTATHTGQQPDWGAP